MEQNVRMENEVSRRMTGGAGGGGAGNGEVWEVLIREDDSLVFRGSDHGVQSDCVVLLTLLSCETEIDGSWLTMDDR